MKIRLVNMKDRFICLSCQKTDNVTLKLMPCLHLYCFDCLEDLVNTNCIAMPKKDENVKCSIFSCSVCGYVVRVINNDTSFLKSVKFHDFDLNETDNSVERDGISGKHYENKDLQSDSYCCQDVSVEDMQMFCNSCQLLLCAKCVVDVKHNQHDFNSDSALNENKRLHLSKLCHKIKQQKAVLLEQLRVNNSICESLSLNKKEVKELIETRCQELAKKIIVYKTNLLSQVESAHSLHHDEQTTSKDLILKDISSLDECLKFCTKMLMESERENVINIFDELASHMSRILLQKRDTSGVVHHLMIEDVEDAKHELLIEKLYGSLVVGSVSHDSPHLANTYNTNMTWPSCMATNTKDFMLAGKSETFGGVGKLLFSDRDMKHVKYIDLPENCIPIDLLHLNDDTLLLSTNDGTISKYNFQGVLLDKWIKVFEGSAGRLARLDREKFFITSGSSQLLVCSVEDGKLLYALSLKIESTIRCMTANGKLIFGILEDHTIKIFDFFGCTNESEFDSESFNSKVKCPSSIVCDPFGNILVSDFMNDSIYFFNRKGSCFGPILSKESDSIMCPNKIMLDSYGNLYVAQYGGDICVFDYLSCAKKV